MSQDEQKSLNLTEVGQKLVGHSKSAEFTATRGLVIELFPFIFEASERMSARAISRFLEEEQKIKLSQVTITRALNDPKKSWLSFFESIEPAAVVTAKYFRPASFKYLFSSKSEYETRILPKDSSKLGEFVAHGLRAIIQPDRAAAHHLLIEKWFSIGLGTRLKAKPYLEEHLMALADRF